MEATLPDPPASVEDEILSRLGRTLQFPLGSPAHGVAPAPRPGVLARPPVRTVATLLLGAALGAGVHETLDRRAARTVSDAVAVAPAPVVSPPRPLPPGPSAEPSAAVPAPLARAINHHHEVQDHAPAIDAPTRDRALAAERALLEQARTALTRGQDGDALTVLERHARTFPQGALAEERESLLVQALVGGQQYERARRAAERFHHRFPNSIFGAGVDEAVASIAASQP